MHSTIYKYSLLVSVFAFFFFSFSLLVNATEYGSSLYNEGFYSTGSPSSGSTGVTQAFRDKFLAEQQALVTQQPVTFTPTPTPSTSLNITRTLKFGMTGEDVKALQDYLNVHGYNCGTADGDFGPKTKAQVILFQKANGLTPDGIVGPLTRGYMNQSQTPVAPPTTTRTLKLGMTGNDVKDLQTYLNTHGYNCGTADGDFGPKTKAQVILFQKAKGLTPDGVVGPMTIKMMK